MVAIARVEWLVCLPVLDPLLTDRAGARIVTVDRLLHHHETKDGYRRATGRGKTAPLAGLLVHTTTATGIEDTKLAARESDRLPHTGGEHPRPNRRVVRRCRDETEA